MDTVVLPTINKKLLDSLIELFNSKQDLTFTLAYFTEDELEWLTALSDFKRGWSQCASPTKPQLLGYYKEVPIFVGGIFNKSYIKIMTKDLVSFIRYRADGEH